MKAERKGAIIGGALGMLPALIALIPFTLAWWYVKGPVWFSTNYVDNLPWVVFFIALWMVAWKGLNLAAGYYLSRR